MQTAYYLEFSKGHHGSENRVGGQPTLLPPKRPWPIEDNQYIGFLLQLKVDGHHLSIPGAEYLQLYQSIEEGDDPLPIAVLIPPGAPKNWGMDILIQRGIGEWDISYKPSKEPFKTPDLKPIPEHGYFFKSKLGGLDPFRENNHLHKFLGHIHQSPVGFNFAGMLCSLYLNTYNEIIVELT